MNCCPVSPCPGTNRFFTRWAKNYAKQFRKKGLDKAQQYLLEGIARVPIAAPEVLDIGCGVGAVHLVLLQQGASRVTGVDMAEGMLAEARRLAEEKQLADRTSYIQNDFITISHQVPQADITILDKVVCCYEKADDLVEGSLNKTKRIYAVTHPRESFIVRWGFLLYIAFSQFVRAAFHPYWHNWQNLRSAISARGFRLVYENSTFFWNVLVFERA
ncbi:MAG: hypothetical protein HBSIN02_19660 [Bacteroidia bacterium]|nr:MAG: hypothetical protein HBSIN02_19660 [Bacteroidia bacterium]